MATSKLQEQTKSRLRLLFSGYNVIENHRPKWLKNPKTKVPLELDFWLPDLDLAIEVQGRQHTEYIPHFHGSIENYQAQLERDQAKKEICKERKIFLYEVFSIEDIDSLIDSIQTTHNPELGYILLQKHTAIKALSFYAARLYVEMRKEKPNHSFLGDISGKIAKMAVRYNIPIKSIEPDFFITKTALGYSTKPIIKIKMVNDQEEIKRTCWAAVMFIENNIATLRWVYSWEGKRIVTTSNFDLLTELEVNPQGYHVWKLNPYSLRKPLTNPNSFIYNTVADIFRNREDMEWKPEEEDRQLDNTESIQEFSPVRRDRVFVNRKSLPVYIKSRR